MGIIKNVCVVFNKVTQPATGNSPHADGTSNSIAESHVPFKCHYILLASFSDKASIRFYIFRHHLVYQKKNHFSIVARFFG